MIGSLATNGTLMSLGSLNGPGTLLVGGSLAFVGTLTLLGSLNGPGTLRVHGSLWSHDTFP